jgi:hypothetical protein
MICPVCNYNGEFIEVSLKEVKFNRDTIKYEPFTDTIGHACPECGVLKIWVKKDVEDKEEE